MSETARQYQSGFGNEYASECVAGALPQGRNSPQRAPFDLYPELISGTAFTAPRQENRRSWMYRRQPSVLAGRFEAYAQGSWKTGAEKIGLPPEPLRWHPLALGGQADKDFVDGMTTIAANGDADDQVGLAAHIYRAGRSMENRALANADGEMLVLPQQGRLVITTELGVLDVAPGEFALLTLEVWLQTARMRAQGDAAVRLSKGNSKQAAYWTAAQLLVHHTVNGCNLRPGDLLGSGTLSGPLPTEAGSLLELTLGGKQPLALPNAETRTFLEDGDTLTLRGYCEAPGAVRIGLGEATATIRGR